MYEYLLGYWEVERYKYILRESLKRELPRILREEEILSNPKKRYKVRIQDVDDPRFIKGRPNRGGLGGGGSGPGQGGSGEEEHALEVEITFEELEEMLWEHLRLPRIKPKRGESRDVEWRMHGISRKGPMSRIHIKRTLLEKIKSGSRDFHRDFLRYRDLQPRPKPSFHAHVILARDCSGSITDDDVYLIRTVAWWTLRWLRQTYNDIDLSFLLHDTRAWQVDEREFFGTTSGGGTVCSTVIREAHKIISYYPEDTNHYMLYFSDGENHPEDKGNFIESLQALAPNLNLFAYGELESSYGLTLYNEKLSNYMPSLPEVRVKKLKDPLEWIKGIFSEVSTDGSETDQ